MKKLFKKIIASVLAATMTMSAVAFTAFAAEDAPETLTLKVGTETAGASNVVAFVNGNKDNKSVTLTPSASAKGKFTAVLTTSDTTPTVGDDGKVTSDAATKDYAAVSVKDGNVVITAGKKTGGSIYVHLFDIKDKKVVAKTASGVKVNIKGAASSIGFYSDDAKTKPVKSIVVGSGTNNGKVYFNGLIKGTGNTVTDNTYTVEADSKNKITLTPTYDKDKGEIAIKAGDLTKDDKGNVKTASGKIIVTNVQSGKKASITVIVENNITATTNEIVSGYATKIEEKGDMSKIDFTTTRAASALNTTSKLSVVILNGEKAFNSKNKLTTAKSKLASVKLQTTTTTGKYRVRITRTSVKEADVTAAAAEQKIYLLVTDASKHTEYIEIGSVTKAGEVKKAGA